VRLLGCDQCIVDRFRRELAFVTGADKFARCSHGRTLIVVTSYMRQIEHKGGQIGGKRRLKTKKQRPEVAAKAAKARRKKQGKRSGNGWPFP